MSTCYLKTIRTIAESNCNQARLFRLYRVGWEQGGGNVPMVMKKQKAVVRRLTPMECERLQGFPDGWTNIGKWTDTKGKEHQPADAPRYKALGNSIALPFWEWMAQRMTAQYDRPTTMASLFDGIGGFPLVFSRHGCTPVWASEIEEFPIAVTKLHFPEDQENGKGRILDKQEDGQDTL